jgi:opacity protein-like surface antigen
MLSADKTVTPNATVQGMNLMNNKLITAAIATALGSGSLIAHAGDWYITAGGGQASHTLDRTQVNDDWGGALVADFQTFDNAGTGIGSTLDSHTNAAWRAGVGYEFLPFLSGEVEYLHLGEAKARLNAVVDGPEGVGGVNGSGSGVSSYKDTAWGVSAVAKFPFIISPYVRAGVLRWDQSVHGNGTVTAGAGGNNTAFGYGYSNSGQSFYAGAGLEYKIPATPVAFRAEWDQLKIADSKPDLVTLSVVVSLP